MTVEARVEQINTTLLAVQASINTLTQRLEDLDTVVDVIRAAVHPESGADQIAAIKGFVDTIPLDVWSRRADQNQDSIASGESYGDRLQQVKAEFTGIAADVLRQEVETGLSLQATLQLLAAILGGTSTVSESGGVLTYSFNRVDAATTEVWRVTQDSGENRLTAGPPPASPGG